MSLVIGGGDYFMRPVFYPETLALGFHSILGLISHEGPKFSMISIEVLSQSESQPELFKAV